MFEQNFGPESSTTQHARRTRTLRIALFASIGAALILFGALAAPLL